MDFTCQVCGITKNIKPYELKTRKACSRKCLRVINKTKMISRSCLSCGKIFQVSECQSRRGGTNCSRSCSVKHARSLGKQSPERTCETCGIRFKARGAEVRMGRARFCSHKCRGPDVSKRMKGERTARVTRACLYCNENFVTLVTRKRTMCSQRCAAANAHNHGKYSNTSIERKIKSFLESKSICFEFQKRIKRIAFPDFVIGNVIVFADGDYWHNYPNGTMKDLTQTAKLEEMGYKVLRFWERDINNHFGMVSDKIIEAVGAM